MQPDTGRPPAGARRGQSAPARAALRRLLPAGIALAAVMTVPLPPPAAAAADVPAGYRIGPGDGLEVEVWRQPDLSTAVTVRPDGFVTLPLVEDRPAAGRTPEELARALEEALAAYVQEPRVSVRVVALVGDPTQQVRVVGAGVARPQALPFREGMTLFDVVGAIGGLGPRASGNAAEIRRREDGRTVVVPVRLADLTERGDLGADRPLRPGDVVVVPAGFLSGDWRLEQEGRVTLSYTDNVRLAPSGQRDPALIAQVQPVVRLSGDSARLVGALEGSLALRQRLLHDSDLEVVPLLEANSTAELVERTLFLDAGASLREQSDSRDDAESVVEGNGRNLGQVRTVSLSPYLINRFGRVATSTVRYTAGHVSGETDALEDSLFQELSARLAAGPSFRRLRWSLDGRASVLERSGREDQTRYEAEASLEYALSPRLDLLGSIGYEDFDDADSGFSGGTWLAGLRLAPLARTTLYAAVGRQDGDDTARLALDWSPGATTTLSLSYDETVDTGQGRLLRAIRPLDPGAPGGFRPETGLPGQVTLTDAATRLESWRLAVSTRQGRTSLSLSGQIVEERALSGAGLDERDREVRTDIAHALSPRTTLTASAAYEQTRERGGLPSEDWRVRVLLGVQVRLSEDLLASLGYAWQKRDSDLPERDFRENGLVLGLRMRF